MTTGDWVHLNRQLDCLRTDKDFSEGNPVSFLVLAKVMASGSVPPLLESLTANTNKRPVAGGGACAMVARRFKFACLIRFIDESAVSATGKVEVNFGEGLGLQDRERLTGALNLIAVFGFVEQDWTEDLDHAISAKRRGSACDGLDRTTDFCCPRCCQEE